MATSYTNKKGKGEYVVLKTVGDDGLNDIDPDDSTYDAVYRDDEDAQPKSLVASYALIMVGLAMCTVLSALGPAVAEFASRAVENEYEDVETIEEAYDSIFLALSINRVIAVPASFIGGASLKKWPHRGSQISAIAQFLAAINTACMALYGYPGYVEVIGFALVFLGFICGYALVVVTTLLLAVHSGPDAAWWINAVALSGGFGFAIGPLGFVLCTYLGDGLYCFYLFGFLQIFIAAVLWFAPPVRITSEDLAKKKPGPPMPEDKKSFKVSLDAKPHWPTVVSLHLFAGLGCGAEFNFPVLLTTYIELTGIESALWGDWLTYGYWTTYLIGRLIKTRHTPHPVRNFALVLPISVACFVAWLMFPLDIWVISAISLILGWSLNPMFPETLNIARAVTPLSIPAMTFLTLSRFLYAATVNIFLIWASEQWGIPVACRWTISLCFFACIPFFFIFAAQHPRYFFSAFGCAKDPRDNGDEDGDEMDELDKSQCISCNFT